MNKLSSILIATCLLLLSCGRRSRHKRTDYNRYSVDQLISGIAESNVVGGELSDMAQVLLEKLPTSQLKALTDHSSTALRCYAFRKLVNKREPDCFSILLNHLRDTAEVITLNGCILSRHYVGDFYFKTLEEKGFNPGQRRTLDSLLIFDNRIFLKAKQEFLDTLQPRQRYYARIREMAQSENECYATPALAKFKRKTDAPLILNLLRSSDADKQYYGFRSVYKYPLPVFFPELKRIISANPEFRNFNGGSSMIRLYMYAAIVLYKTPSSRKILEDDLKKVTGRELVDRTDLMFQALKENPDSIYIGVVKYDFMR